MAVATAANGNGNGTAMAAASDKEMSFVPFGSKESIKLSASIIQKMVCVPTKSGKVCTEIEAIKFMMLCKARALNPFEGDAFLIGYDTQNGPAFSLITAHQAFLKRAEVHPEYDGMESGVMVRDENGSVVDREGDFFFEGDTILGAWAVVYFKNRTHPMKKRIRLASFVKSYGRWKDDAAGMIVKCSEADALRSSFPTMLGGLYIEGESPLHFVNEAPKAPEIPVGRSKLPRATTAAPEQHIDTANGEIPNETPTEPTDQSGDAAPEFDQDAADQWYMKLENEIEESATMLGMQKIGETLKAKAAVLGTKNFDELMAAYQRKSGELLAAKKK